MARRQIVSATQVDPREGGRWLILSEYSGDLDGDDSPEDLQLLVHAERYPEGGEIVWDDGQPWLLLVTDGELFYPLLNEYVQLGAVYFRVYDGAEGKTEVQILIGTGSQLRLGAVTHDAARGGYRINKAYTSKGYNLLHTSIPPYR